MLYLNTEQKSSIKQITNETKIQYLYKLLKNKNQALRGRGN